MVLSTRGGASTSPQTVLYVTKEIGDCNGLLANRQHESQNPNPNPSLQLRDPLRLTHMADWHPIEQQIASAWPPDQWRNGTVVVAVSGGGDSVGLTRALLRVRLPGTGGLVLAHFNHRWRGAESDADEVFVRDLAAQWGLACQVGWGGDETGSANGSSEAAAREQRYAFLRRVCHQLGARYLAMAHTAQDQAETILHRIVRGTGLAGLAGIPACRPLSELTTIVRPLLGTDRGDVEAYLRALGQSFRTDSTNADPGFTRNRIRLELLPLLRESYNSQVDQSLQRLGDLARQAQQLVDAVVDTHWDQAVTVRGDGSVRVDCEKLRGVNELLAGELLRRLWRAQNWPLQSMSQEKWSSLAQVVLGPRETRQVLILPGAIRAERDARSEFLILTAEHVRRHPPSAWKADRP